MADNDDVTLYVTDANDNLIALKRIGWHYIAQGDYGIWSENNDGFGIPLYTLTYGDGKPDVWAVGDRVSLCPTGNEANRVSATVTGIDDGPGRGVSVALDRPVNGVDTAYATHAELTRLVPDSDLADEAAARARALIQEVQG